MIILLIGATYGIGVFAQLKDGGMTDPASESNRQAALVQHDFPDSQVSLLFLFHHPTLTVEEKSYRDAVQSSMKVIQADPATRSVLSYSLSK